MRERTSWVFLLCSTFILLVSCDTAPGPARSDNRPPVLSDFSFSPQIVSLSDVPENQIEGDMVRIPVTMQVAARDDDGSVTEVTFTVRSPISGKPLIAVGSLEQVSEGQYATTADVRIPTAEVGKYTVLLQAVDDEGALSNDARGMLSFADLGSSPVIEAVEMPESIQRPAPGETDAVLQIVAVVSDPDGLNNIARVTMRNPNRPNLPAFDLLDDGGALSGDEVAGDGRYTITVRISSDNEQGTNTFLFQAFDRAGLSSSIVEKQITVL